jgi:DNA-binding NarL/FixJ family response regulator
MTRVLIVDDSRVARSYLLSCVAGLKDYTVVKSLTSASDAVMYCELSPVDLVLMDVYTANGENGLKAVGQIKAKRPEIKAVAVTSMPEESFLRKAREVGCDSLWYKETGEDELADVIRRTMAGERLFPDRTPAVRIGCAASTEFTPAELRTLRAMIDCGTRARAAEALGVTPEAVKKNVAAMLQKTGCVNMQVLCSLVTSKNLIVKDFSW